PEAPPATDPPAAEPFGQSVDEVYDEILFHGTDLRAIERIESMGEAGALAFVRTSPPPSTWNSNPVRAAWLADPLALDTAFQLLSVWSFQVHQAVSLPCFAGSYRQFRRAFPGDGVSVSVRVRKDAGSTVRADVEFTDADGRLVAKLTDAEHVVDAS